MKKGNLIDKKKLLREQDRLTRPPRLEGKAKNSGMNPRRKTKQSEQRESKKHNVFG